MRVSSTKSRDTIITFWFIARLATSTFRASTMKMIKYKYRLSSNILLYITSTCTFDMYLDTITKYQVHFRNYRCNKYMHNKINETKSSELNSIVFGTLYLVNFCSLTNLLKQLI